MVLLNAVVVMLGLADAHKLQERRDRSSRRLSPSQEMIASLFVWLPSMIMRSGRTWRATERTAG